MNASNTILSGVFCGANIEPGTFHGANIEPGTFHNFGYGQPPLTVTSPASAAGNISESDAEVVTPGKGQSQIAGSDKPDSRSTQLRTAGSPLTGNAPE